MFKLFVDIEPTFRGDFEEVGRILRSVAAQVHNGKRGGVLFDSKGQQVGTFTFQKGET